MSLSVESAPAEQAAAPASPPPEPRSRNVLVAATLLGLAVVGVVLSALSVSDRATTATPTRPGSVPAVPVASASAVPGLAAPILVLPSPWVALDDLTAHTGRVDLARAAEIDGQGDLSRQALQALGYQLGQSRSWRNGTATLLALDYTFRTQAGARGYVDAAKASRASDPAYVARAVSGVPGAAGFARAQPAPSTVVVVFSRGRSAFLLAVQGTADVAGLARQQYAAAPAG